MLEADLPIANTRTHEVLLLHCAFYPTSYSVRSCGAGRLTDPALLTRGLHLDKPCFLPCALYNTGHE